MAVARRVVLSAMGAAAVGGVAATGYGAPAQAGETVRTGLDVLIAEDWRPLRGTKVGVISNPTGMDGDYQHEVDLMVDSGAVTVLAAFGPEHGFRGSNQAGSGEGTGVDERTGLPVYDAYGASQQDWVDMFTDSGVQTVLFDIQDVGARFYTYIWTLYDSMAAAARLGLRYVVLDRPNPVGGTAYGPMMTPEYESGVGEKPIVQQHGMTVGELAGLYNGEFVPDDAGRPVDLEVVELRGWRSDQLGVDLTGVPWVLPSPNMPTQTTALVYPGTCLFEGTNASEGRGTTRPFELVGAPYLDYHWTDRLNDYGLPGVRFREAYFTPTFDKYTNVLCNATEVEIVDPHAYRPIDTAVAMLVEAHAYDGFAWRYDTDDPARPYWVDKLSGSTRLRTMIDAGATAAEVVAAWTDELAAFRALRRQYLRYPGPHR